MATNPKIRSTASLADALLVPQQGTAEQGAWRQLAARAAWAVGVVVMVLLLWSTLAPLSGAVIAGGVVKTELNRKTVQHQEGGIVREILVREGQQVMAGDALVVVGDVRAEAALDLQRDQAVAAAIREARLMAELKLADHFELPKALTNKVNAPQYLERERALFMSRRHTLVEQLASLTAQVRETEDQVQALGSQIESTARSADSAREELRIHRDLVAQGFVQRTLILGLERAVADYDARAGEQQGDRAQARQRLAELRSRIAQTRFQYQQQAAGELKDTVAQLRELDERLRPARDQVDRQVVRSPVDGVVMSLRVAAVGLAVGPREPILDVVPENEALVVEARLKPEDIDYVRAGALADVRLTAYEFRAMPMLPGRVISVSADRVEDERSGQAWFKVLVEVDAERLADFPGVQMQAGMPAETYVRTPSRSLFDYLARPLLVFGQRGMREP